MVRGDGGQDVLVSSAAAEVLDTATGAPLETATGAGIDTATGAGVETATGNGSEIAVGAGIDTAAKPGRATGVVARGIAGAALASVGNAGCATAVLVVVAETRVTCPVGVVVYERGGSVGDEGTERPAGLAAPLFDDTMDDNSGNVSLGFCDSGGVATTGVEGLLFLDIRASFSAIDGDRGKTGVGVCKGVILGVAEAGGVFRALTAAAADSKENCFAIDGPCGAGAGAAAGSGRFIMARRNAGAGEAAADRDTPPATGVALRDGGPDSPAPGNAPRRAAALTSIPKPGVQAQPPL